MTSSNDSKTLAVRSEIWKSDGNLVLQAENMQFRVHKSFLADNSAVFKDMLSAPVQPPPDVETIDGCEVVLMHDSADDWDHVLRALYERGYFVACKQVTFATISSIMRLGSKYQMDSLRREAVDILQSAFFNRYESWYRIKPHDELGLNFYPGIFVDIANLADELGLPTILPTILLRFMQVKPLELVIEGPLRSDGTKAMLNANLLRRFILGRERLHKIYADDRLGWLGEGGDVPAQDSKCSSVSQCRGIKRKLALKIFPIGLPCQQNVISEEFPSDWSRGLCEDCVTTARATFDSGLRRVYTIAPICFGYPSWDELEAMA